MGSTPAGRTASRQRAALRAFGRRGAGTLPICAREIFLRQCFQPVEQILLACDSDDLVAQLTILEEK